MKFKSDIEVQAGLKDSSGSNGSSGQVLSSNGGTISWINSGGGTASDVQNQVKAGVAINKGQAVYVTSADGTNIIVGLASNTTEATSSKTLGLLNATVAINGFADVVQIGKLEGLDTSTATVGDPVWLGTNGNLIYGLANKPYAPAHLVYIGVVTRVNANNGEIFVTVQNGFELKEIHDVDIITTPPSGGDVLGFEGAPVNLWVNKTIPGWLGYTPVPTTRTLTINGSTQDLSANRTFTIDTGVTSFNTRTGAVTLTSGDVTTALGYTPVTQARTLTINGTTYDLSANRSWTVTTPETDTLATVTARGNVANTSIAVRNSILVNKSDGSSGGQLSYDSSINQLYLWNSVSSGYFSVYTNSAERLNISSGGAVTANVDMRSPIFYDSNNTGYYLDPASTSNLNIITTTGYVSIGGSAYLASGNSLYFDSGVTNDYSIKKNGTAMQFDSGGDFTFNKGVNILTTRDNALVLRAMDGGTNPWNYIEYVNSAGTRKYYVGTDTSNVFNIYSDDGTGYVGSNTSFRAPIFYDSNDTTYYGDFASTSNFSKLLLNSQNSFNTTTPGLTSYGLTLMGGTADYANGVTWTWGNTNAQAGVYVQSSGAYGTKMYFATTDSFATGSKTGMSMDHNGTVLVTRSYLQSDSSLRAPIFYDSNNTGYYVDPASTSRMVTSNIDTMVSYYGMYNSQDVSVNSTYGVYWQNSASTDYGIYKAAGAWTQPLHINFYTGIRLRAHQSYGGTQFYNVSSGNTVMGVANGNDAVSVYTDMRSPIYYDYNNTGYYLDPASTSNLNVVNASMFNGRITPLNGTSSVIGQVQTSSSINMGIAAGNYGYGISTNSAGGLDIMANQGSQPIRFWSGTANESPTKSADFNGTTVNFYGNTYAPILYDSNNTGYYLDPNSTSNLYAADFSGPSHFTSNLGGYCGSLSNPPLQPYSTSNNSAFFSFHKGGNYAVNMGLDADNVIRIGGWSASANRWELDMSGNNWVAGSFRAPIFYDSDNTGYYINAAGSSNISSITVNAQLTSYAASSGAGLNCTMAAGLNGGTGAVFNGSTGTAYGSTSMTVYGSSYGAGIKFVTGAPGYTNSNAAYFYSNTTQVGSISCTTTNTTYATSSDYRLKENVKPMLSSIDRVKALKPCTFNFKVEKNKVVDGFIAHEVQEVVPEAVTGHKDEIDPTGTPVYQGIDQSKLVPLLTAALQEAIEKINSLEQRINILENK